jgi:predicted secreted protein
MAGCESGAFTGRDVMVYYYIDCPANKPSTDKYKRLGMMRGKTLGAEWDTADATGDMSPSFTKENLTTYKSVSFSGDGVSRKEEVYNQALLKAHVFNPGPETNNQPFVWLKIVSPLDITEGPFLMPKWEDQAPFDDVATWSTEASSAGGVTVKPLTGTISITTQPVSKNLIEGDNLSLSVVATSSDGSTLAYQWRKDGTDIPGATSATYTKSSVVEADEGTYTVIIASSTAGAAVSAAASIVVGAPA